MDAAAVLSPIDDATATPVVPIDWEQAIGDLLTDLSAAQDELLGVLKDKQRVLVTADVAGLDAIADRERAVLDRLQHCHDERARLLKLAADEGQPAQTLRQHTDRLPGAQAAPIRQRLDSAAAQSRLLKHHCLTNWVLAQQALVHLSQLVELIATGGRRQPTYSNGATSCATGTLVDEQA
jgi:hypothetical protein